MSAYQTFTSARATDPDPGSLAKSLRALDATMGYALAAGAYLVKKATAFSQADLAAVQSAIDTAPAASADLATQSAVDNLPLLEKAILLTLLDQINIIRSKLPTPLGAITPAQAIQAVRDKAGTL